MKRLSVIDDIFLRLETRRQPLHIAVLMLLEPPADAPADFVQSIAQRLRKYTASVPPFNQKLVQRQGMHFWEEDDDFDLDQHFVHLSLPKPGRIRELLAMVSRVHCGHLDRSYPMWRMYLIEGLEDGRMAVYMKIHHSMVDGVAGMRLLLKSMSVDIQSSAEMPPAWAINVKKSRNAQPLPIPTPGLGSFSALRTLAREGIASSAAAASHVGRELMSTLRDFRNKNPDLALAGTAPHSLLNEKVSGSRRFAAQSYSTSRIKAIARHYEATSNDVILAMCGSALRRYLKDRNALPDKPLLAAVPVSVRRQNKLDEAGNEIAFAITHLATQMDDPAERLAAIKNCMDYNKERIQHLSPGELMSYAATLILSGSGGTLKTLLGYKAQTTLTNLVISHVPGPRQTLYWQGAKLSGLYPVSLVLDSCALNITIISRQDLIDFGIIACRKTVPQVQRLLDYLEDAIAELEATIAPAPQPVKRTKPVAARVKPAVQKARPSAGNGIAASSASHH